MKFADVLAIRPATTDPACLSIAIAEAKAKRIAALDFASALESEITAKLLTADDEEMEAKEREATTARRAADRLESLIVQMCRAMEDAHAPANAPRSARNADTINQRIISEMAEAQRHD